VPWIIVLGHVPLYCANKDCGVYYDHYQQFDTLFY